MTEEVAIIRNPKYGVDDRGRVTLRFDTYTSESTAALQVLSVDKATEALLQADVDDVHLLNGKPCWVEHGNGLIIFKRMWTS